jgi:hypothetical protein
MIANGSGEMRHFAQYLGDAGPPGKKDQTFGDKQVKCATKGEC